MVHAVALSDFPSIVVTIFDRELITTLFHR